MLGSHRLYLFFSVFSFSPLLSRVLYNFIYPHYYSAIGVQVCVCVCACFFFCVCAHAYSLHGMHVWRSEDNFMEFDFSPLNSRSLNKFIRFALQTHITSLATLLALSFPSYLPFPQTFLSLILHLAISPIFLDPHVALQSFP